MAESRYTFSKKLGDGTAVSSASTFKINRAVSAGAIPSTTIILEQGQRLDHLAYAFYRDSSLWWVIAAASGIGWGLQVPPGVTIKVPSQINQVLNIL